MSGSNSKVVMSLKFIPYLGKSGTLLFIKNKKISIIFIVCNVLSQRFFYFF